MQQPSRGGWLHHRQRHELPEHRGRESALFAAGEGIRWMLCAWAGGRTGVGLLVVGSEDRVGHPQECLNHLPLRDVNIFDEAVDSGPCGLPGPGPALRSGMRPTYWYRHSPSVGLHIARRRRGQHPDRWHRPARESSSAVCVPRRVGPHMSGGRLQGKVCLITGAGSGIGQATARLFAREGAQVVVADVDDRGARSTVASIRKSGGEAVAEHADVTDEHDTITLAAKVAKRFKRIDVLFNNAGISGVGDVLETEPDLFDRVMRVNVRGVYLTSRAVVPYMIKQGFGSIINMSSCIAEIGLARRVSYAASKGAVLSMTKSMQVDLAQHGIRVNALLPGTILTPFVERYLKESYKDPEEGYSALVSAPSPSFSRPSRSSRLPLKERWPSLSLGH